MNIVKLNNDRITLINADCLEVLPKIKVNAIDLAILDLPYYKVTSEAWDRQWNTELEYIHWAMTISTTIHTKMKDTASFYFWQGIGFKQQVLLDIAIKLREVMIFQDWITWQKSGGMGNRRGWLYTREECLWFTKTDRYGWNELAQYDYTQPTNRSDNGFNGKPRKSQYKRYTNVWQCNEDQNYGADRVRSHYTPKPLLLIERIINAHTSHDFDVVLDPTMGSGTTAVACINLNRRCIGIERDTTIFNAAVARCEQAIVERQLA